MVDETESFEVESSFESPDQSGIKALLAKRLPLLIAGVVLVIILGFFIVTLVSSPSSSNSTPKFILNNPTSPAHVHSSSPRSSSGTGKGTQVFSSRDPFVSPVPVPTTTPPTTVGPVTTTTTVPTTTSPTATPTTSPTTSSGSSSGTPSGTGTFYPQPDQQISLLNIASGTKPVADVQVGGVDYQVVAGQKFASNYQVISLSPSNECGQFSYKGSPFQLCKSQQILK